MEQPKMFTNYKHTPPDKPEKVKLEHVKDWWVVELGSNWDSTIKYTILKAYNHKFFQEYEKSLANPQVFVKKNIRYLNRA